MNLNTVTNNPNLNIPDNSLQDKKGTTSKEETTESLEQTLEKSAVEVSISMNAQIVLLELDSKDFSKTTTLTQATLSDEKQDILNFLSGEEASSGLTLKDIGYEGKPILELTQEEAQELVSEDGFFGVTQTSDRVANFVFSFAGDDLELLQKGREGIIKGFEEAEELFGGELPDISYETQERTLRLIDEKINSLSPKESSN